MILDLFRLDGKVAMVTGPGTGLGQAIALGLAEAGADIVGVYRESFRETQQMVEALGRRFLPMQADLSRTTPEDLRRLIDRAVAEMGRLDILVNNAGIIRRTPALEFSEADWDEVMQVNLKSAFFLSQAAARHFVSRSDVPEGHSRGKIIHIASMLSFQGGILVASYTASKSGLAGITRLLANEWAPYGINVNAIAPGYMATRNTEPLRRDPQRNPAILARIPAGRWGRPDDLKGAAVFLASEASNYMHGAIVPVDGGWLAR
ncbi:MAG: 2-dehydro-3-deoxy-D-gluconate 5-dehydrogenase KduD [Chloroflexi bacterium]|nr:2-dehydro-3-deoxy-D-gluconate 5-dehydrogenase KduD [Chloroflexota bacterium]